MQEMKARRKSIIAEAKILADVHPSKDCRRFCKSIIKFFEDEKRDVLQQLTGSVTHHELCYKKVFGVNRNL